VTVVAHVKRLLYDGSNVYTSSKLDGTVENLLKLRLKIPKSLQGIRACRTVPESAPPTFIDGGSCQFARCSVLDNEQRSVARDDPAECPQYTFLVR
jgi:hypothetical protein